MAKERLIDLQQTRGTFEVRGIVTGTDKDKFFEERPAGKNTLRSVNFGVKVNEEQTVYVGLQGFTRDEVVFYKRADKKTGAKGESQKVPWGKRFDFKKDGFSLIGTNVGVSKVLDEKGKYVNDKKTLVEFDACDEIAKNLKDDESVFIKGNIEFSSFEDRNSGDTRRNIRLTPNQVSLCSKDVDFKAEDYKPMHDFTQTIIFMGITKETDDDGKETGRFIISAKIVNYNSIEDAEFITENARLANVMRKTLKPYNAIEIYGKISAGAVTEDVKVDDEWGEANEMKRVSGGYKREFIVTGADKESIDTELYSEKSVEAAIEKIKAAKAAKDDFGDTASDNDGWGAAKEASDEDDEW